MSQSAAVLIIINHAAARARDAWPGVREALLGGGVRFDLHEARHAGDAQERTRAALHAGTRTVAALGGDGTLSEVASGFFDSLRTCGDDDAPPRLVNASAALALLPAGTGDDFARGLTHGTRAPLDEWVARLVRHGAREGDTQTTRQVDVLYGKAEGDGNSGDSDDSDGDSGGGGNSGDSGGGGVARRFLCLNAATLGIGAEVAAGVAAQGEWTRKLSGEVRFAVAAVKALAAWRNRLVRVRVDEGEWTQCRTNLLAVCNGAYAGGGMHFSPGARIDDGLLDVVTVGDLSRAVVVRELTRIHRGGHLANPKVRVTRGTRVRVEAVDEGETLSLEADGDVRGHTPIEFRVLPAALRIVW